MIYEYLGTPGSGKSYHAADNIYHWLRYGKKNVICNFSVDIRRIFYTRLGRIKFKLSSLFHHDFKKYNSKPIKNHYFFCDNSDLTPAYLVKFAQEHHKVKTIFIDGVEQRMYLEGQTTVIIDECAVLFNCRMWQNSNREEWCEFLRQHRKYGYDFILITQSEILLDKQIRPLIETIVMHRNLKYFNWFASIISFLCGGSTFVSLYRWQGTREVYHREIYKYKSHIADIYNSYQIFSPASAADAEAAPQRGTKRGRGTASAPPKDNKNNEEVLECVKEFLVPNS